MVNPLLDYARRAELSVKLPSNCSWYPENMIKYTLNGEVEVYPMTPKDELTLMNPDSLLSGEANIKLIESCVPSVSNAGQLLYPDANLLLLAIHKATYGNKMTINFICPKCAEKALLIKDESKIAEAEKNGELLIRTQETEIKIDEFLQNITFLDNEYIYETSNGLKIFYSPTLLRDKLYYGLIEFNNQKLLNYFKDYNFEEYNLQEDKKQILSQVNDIYLNINDEGNKLITDCIRYIQLPDGSFIDDKELILEYISQTKSTIVKELHQKIRELNDIGITQEVEHCCDCCGHTFSEKLVGYNQVDFFGYGS